MAISASDVAELRKQTGAGLMDAKRALEEAKGDASKATEALRIKGLAKAGKRSGRTAAEGVVTTYTHGDRIGVLVELNCETDFVARNSEFKDLAHELALQVAASHPRYLSPEEVPAAEIEEEERLARSQAEAAGKPAAALEQIVKGQIGKFYSEHCLLNQVYVKDPSKTVGDLITGAATKLGEKIEVRRFARFELAEG